MTEDESSVETHELRATVSVLKRPPPDALHVRGNDFMTVGESWQFDAVAEWLNPINRNDDVTREVMWKSSNRSVTTVFPTGNVLTHKVGTAIISAELSGVRSDVTVQVLR